MFDFIRDGLVAAINLLIEAVGAFVAAVLSLLPALPDPPSPPTGGVLGAVCWLIPLGPLLGVWAAFLAAYVAMLAIRIALRWAKAI